MGPLTRCALATGLLLLLIPNTFTYRDALWNALRIAHEPFAELIHPHHPGYLLFLKGVWVLLGSPNGAEGALQVLVGFSRLGAAAVLVIWTWWLGLLRWEDRWRATGIALVAVAFGFWEYATSGGIYCPTIALLLAAMALLYRWQETGPATRTAWIAGGLLAAAFAIHQLILLFLPGLCWWAWSQGRQAGWSPGRILLGLLLPLVGLIGAFYLGAIAYFVARFGGEGLGEFLYWATEYGHTSGYWWWHTVPEGASPVVHFLRLIASAHFRLFFGYTGVELVGIDPSGEGLGLPGALKALLALGALVVIGLLGVLIVRLWRSDPSWHPLGRLVLWAYAPLLVFLVLFEVHAPYYRLYYLMWIWLWILGALRWYAGTSPRAAGIATAAVIAMLALSLGINTFLGWAPRSNSANNQYLVNIAAVDAVDSAPLAFRSGKADHLCAVYTAVFTSRPVWLIRPPSEVSRPPANLTVPSARVWCSVIPPDPDWSPVLPGYIEDLRTGKLVGRFPAELALSAPVYVEPPYYFAEAILTGP